MAFSFILFPLDPHCYINRMVQWTFVGIFYCTQWDREIDQMNIRSLGSFLDTVQNSNTAGSFYWSLFGHTNDCCGYVQHVSLSTLSLRGLCTRMMIFNRMMGILYIFREMIAVCKMQLNPLRNMRTR